MRSGSSEEGSVALIIADLSEEAAAELVEVLNERFPYEYKSGEMVMGSGRGVYSDGPIDRELLAGVRAFARGYVAARERLRAEEP